jgi:hypothetical protein
MPNASGWARGETAAATRTAAALLGPGPLDEAGLHAAPRGAEPTAASCWLPSRQLGAHCRPCCRAARRPVARPVGALAGGVAVGGGAAAAAVQEPPLRRGGGAAATADAPRMRGVCGVWLLGLLRRRGRRQGRGAPRLVRCRVASQKPHACLPQTVKAHLGLVRRGKAGQWGWGEKRDTLRGSDEGAAGDPPPAACAAIPRGWGPCSRSMGRCGPQAVVGAPPPPRAAPLQGRGGKGGRGTVVEGAGRACPHLAQ